MKQIKTRFWFFYFIILISFSLAAGMILKYNQTGNALDPSAIVPMVVIFLTGACINYLVRYVLNKAKTYSKTQINKRIVPAIILLNIATFIIANLSIQEISAYSSSRLKLTLKNWTDKDVLLLSR